MSSPIATLNSLAIKMLAAITTGVDSKTINLTANMLAANEPINHMNNNINVSLCLPFLKNDRPRYSKDVTDKINIYGFRRRATVDIFCKIPLPSGAVISAMETQTFGNLICASDLYWEAQKGPLTIPIGYLIPKNGTVSKKNTKTMVKNENKRGFAVCIVLLKFFVCTKSITILIKTNPAKSHGTYQEPDHVCANKARPMPVNKE